MADQGARFVLIVAIARRLEEKRQQRQQRRAATLPYVLRRHEFGAFHALVQELKAEDINGYKNFLRMRPETFDQLLHLVGPVIQKQDTKMKDSICPAERLSVTLRWLASGEPSRFLLFADLFTFCGLHQFLFIRTSKILPRLD